MTKVEKVLEGVFTLNHHIRIYVPSKVGTDDMPAVMQQEWIDRVTAKLAEWYGGATITPAMGAWMSRRDGLVCEKVTIVEAYASAEAVEASIADTVILCKDMRDALKQESIAMEYDNKMLLW